MLITRRIFLKGSILSSAVLLMSGCNVFGAVPLRDTLEVVQTDLFPFSNELKVDVFSYINIILNHSRISDEDKQFLKNGVGWLNEEAILHYDKVYVKLSPNQRQNILESISKENWGESWIESILGYIMEAIFSDKVYGVNLDEKAHKWLNFSFGLPKPQKALL